MKLQRLVEQTLVTAQGSFKIERSALVEQAGLVDPLFPELPCRGKDLLGAPQAALHAKGTCHERLSEAEEAGTEGVITRNIAGDTAGQDSPGQRLPRAMRRLLFALVAEPDADSPGLKLRRAFHQHSPLGPGMALQAL